MSEKSVDSTSISSIIGTWMDKTHQFIDTHPRTIIYSAYSVGALGLVILLRSTHVGKFIKHGSEIPKRFISKGVKLQGTVKEVHTDGIIYVQHLPLLNLRLPWKEPSGREVELLPMTLAFVDLTSTGSRDWLKQNLLNKHVWFQALKVETENQHLVQSAIYTQKFLLWRTCINEKLIMAGRCKVLAVPEEDLKNLTVKQTELLDRMISLERTADKKGKGIWKEEKPSLSQTVKKWLYLPVVLVKSLYHKTRIKLKRA